MHIGFAETAVAAGRTILIPYDLQDSDAYNAEVASGNWVIEGSCLFIRNLFRDEITERRTFFDIGANRGIYSLVLAELDVPTTAVEALPHNFLLLVAGLRRNGLRNVRPMLAAATSELGLVRIAGESAWGHVSDCGTPVPGITLDDLAAISDGPPPALIKIDVEGHEISVLRGATQVIETTPDLDFVVECFPGNEESLEFLEQRGYNCYLLKMNGLIRAGSTDFIGSHVNDFYCTRRKIERKIFAGVEVVSLDTDISIKLIAAEVKNPAIGHRLSIAKRLKHAPADLLDLPAVRQMIDELRADADIGVREAACALR